MDFIQEKCPICYESFNKYKKPYILLICGHTFCSYCINQIKKECLEDEEKYIKLSEFYKQQKKQTNLSDSQASLFSDNCKKKSSFSSDDSPHYNQNEIDNISKDSDSYDEVEDDEDNEEYADDEDKNIDNKKKDNDENNVAEEDDFDDEEEDNELDDDKNEEEEEEESSEDEDNDNDDNSEKSFNNINDIIAINEANAKKDKKIKTIFKFKCPFCSVRIKISDKELIINENILKINEIANNEINTNNTDSNNKYFCESCNNVVDNYIHYEQFGNRHDDCLFELNNNMFNRAFNNLKTFIQSKDEISSKIKIFLKNFNEYISKDIKLISDAKKNFMRYCKYNSKFMNVIKKSEKKMRKIEQTIKKKHENNKNIKLKEEIEYLENVKSFSQLINGVFFFPQLKMKLNSYKEIKSNQNSLKIYIDHSIKEIYNQFLENGFFHFLRNKLYKLESKYIPFYSTLTKRNFLFNSELNVLIKLKVPQKYSRYCYESSSDGSTIYGFGPSITSSTSDFYSINTHKKNIKKLNPIPLIDFKQLDTILYNDMKLFVIGGLDKFNMPITSCFFYVIKKDLWHKMPKLKYNRYNKALYISGKDLLVFGGKCDAKDSSYIFEKIDLTTLKSWETFTVKNFSADIYNFGYCAYNQDIIFIVGGEDQVTEDYVKKGYAIDLKKKSVIEEFNINDVLENNIHTPKCYRGIILSTDKELYNIDFFNVWKRLHKLNINLP